MKCLDSVLQAQMVHIYIFQVSSETIVMHSAIHARKGLRTETYCNSLQMLMIDSRSYKQNK